MRLEPQTASSVIATNRATTAACWAILLAAGAGIGLAYVHSTGPLWPDAPRYANGAAMIHDWLRSGDWLHPIAFAKENYTQYPAFSIPYHPPAYPGLMALAFLATGVSYVVARAFIAVCLGLSGGLVFALLRKLGAGPGASLACALLLLTMPSVVVLARDTQSEIPALVFILAASYLFLVWLETGRPWHCWLAFALAEVAFLSRWSTAGVLPGWFLFAAATGHWRRLFTVPPVLASALYLGVNVTWVVLVGRVSRYELQHDNAYWSSPLSWQNLTFYPSTLPALAGWAACAAAAAGTVSLALQHQARRQGLFWLAWLVSYYGVCFAIAGREQRYFVYALPACVGLAACLFAADNPPWLRRAVGPGLVGLALVWNVWDFRTVPRGVVGYEQVGACLARQEKPGNVLLACHEDPDLTFRYRSWPSTQERILYRGDRTLVVRPPVYVVDVATEVHARAAQDVNELVRRGRIRYLVTVAPVDPRYDDRLEEMVLAHDVAIRQPQWFRRIDTFPLLIDFYSPTRRSEVFVWEYLGELPPGPSELSVVVPTAGLSLRPDS